MNEKYNFYMVKNMHQLFLQVTKEGAKDTEETFDNMLNDIDALVEGVYRDRMDRANFHKQFLLFSLACKRSQQYLCSLWRKRLCP